MVSNHFSSDPYDLELASGAKIAFDYESSITGHVINPYSMKTEEAIDIGKELGKLIKNGGH